MIAVVARSPLHTNCPILKSSPLQSLVSRDEHTVGPKSIKLSVFYEPWIIKNPLQEGNFFAKKMAKVWPKYDLCGVNVAKNHQFLGGAMWRKIWRNFEKIIWEH